MAPYPRVPANQFGQARLPRRVKRRLKRQADRAAERIYAPEIDALQAQKAQVRRQYRRDVASAQGTVDFAQNAIESESLKGLHGSARRQVAQELARSSRDVAQSLPFLTSEAVDARRTGLSGIRSDILSAKVEQAQTAARTFNSGLEEARTKAAQYLAQQEADKAAAKKDAASRAKNKRQAHKSLKTAVQTGLNLLATGAMNPDKPEVGVPWSQQAIKHYGTEDQAWTFFEHMLAEQEAIDPQAAHKAVLAIRKRLMGPLNPHSNQLPGDPGVHDILGG